MRIHLLHRRIRRASREQPGDSFSAVFIVGYFDSVDEMNKVYDQHKAGRRN